MRLPEPVKGRVASLIPMNRAEIIEEYDLPTLHYDSRFLDLYNQLSTLVRNKDRAYERLINGKAKTHRRASKKPTGTSTPGLETETTND